jgi:hypothetical protein
MGSEESQILSGPIDLNGMNGPRDTWDAFVNVTDARLDQDFRGLRGRPSDQHLQSKGEGNLSGRILENPRAAVMVHGPILY